MKEFVELKEKINSIIEKSNDKPACKNCKSYNEGICTFGCVNERNGKGYRFNNGRMTTEDYSCGNFEVAVNITEETRDTLRNIIKDIDKVNEENLNLNLFLSGKITEEEFNEILK